VWSAGPRFESGALGGAGVAFGWLGGWRRKLESSGAHFVDNCAVLRVETKTEGVLAFGVERKEIGIGVRATVHHTAAAMDGGIDQRVVRAAVLGLNVVGDAAQAEVRVVTKEHFREYSWRRRRASLTVK
jgi:hypothetical protein